MPTSCQVYTTIEPATLAIMIFELFHDLSFGILEEGAMSTITAAVTLITAGGGLPNDFSSVRLALFSVFRASAAACCVCVCVCV